MEYKTEKNRVVCRDGGRELGQVNFPAVNTGVVKITRTYVNENLRGRGIAGEMMQLAADSIRGTGRRVIPQCSYAVSWFEDHPEYSDILSV